MQATPEKRPRRRIKKVKGHGGHHGGAWKVAYADFVTAMMALFLVLWLVSQADTKLKAAIANYFRSPGAFDTVNGGILNGQEKMSKDPAQTNAKLEEQMLTDVAQFLRKQFLDRPEFADYKDQIKIQMTDEGLEIQIIDKDQNVSFPSASADLTPKAKEILDVIAKSLCGMPNPIKIAGHTDRNTFPDGSVYTNWELSTDRANAARRELESVCVRPDQINSVVGYADSRPADASDPYAAANRRISIVIMKTQQGEHIDLPEGSEPEHDVAKASAPATAPETAPQRQDASETKPQAPALAAPPLPGKTDDAKAAAHTLATQGSVSVGAPDALPTGASRVKERAPARTRE